MPCPPSHCWFLLLLLRDIAPVFVFSFSSVLNFPSVLNQCMACRDTRTLCSLKYWGFHHCSDGKDSACSAGDLDSILGAGRSPGEGDGNPLQYSCLEDSMDRGAWRGHKESDTTERLTHTTTSIPGDHSLLANKPFLYSPSQYSSSASSHAVLP